MRLLTGPPGSGKTTRVLEEVRAHLRAGRSDFRLLTPTATMAGHVRNLLARQGLVFRPSVIDTLYGFVDSLEGLPPQAGDAVVPLALDQWIERSCPAVLRPLILTPGLRPALEAALTELVNAGCDSLRLEAIENLGTSDPLLRALREALSAVEDGLARRGEVLRSNRLLKAAQAIGLRRQELFIDGFFTFLPAELELIQSLARHAPVTVTLPAWPGAEPARQALKRAGARETVLGAVRPSPPPLLIAAASREDEVLEVARRILAEHEAGRAWNEIGVVLRSAGAYAPLLATTFRRLGIPARFYFARPLAAEASATICVDWIECALRGFDGAEVLRCLRHPAVRFARLPRWKEIEAAVRDRFPCGGLDTFLQVAAEPALEILREWVRAGDEALPPSEWAVRCRRLALLVDGPRPDPAPAPDDVARWQARARALRAWQEVWQAAVDALGPEPVTLAKFWRTARPALDRAQVFTAQDGPRQSVHVMGVYEARQWELPVVFLCGMLEGEFPRRESGDPLLEESLRERLNGQGVPLVTRAGRRQEELFLLELAFSRATQSLVISWPRFDEKGEATQRAYALDRFAAVPVHPRPVRIRPARRPRLASVVALASQDSLAALSARYQAQRPSWLESFLQCPFQFFGRYTLQLEAPAGGLEEKLGPLALGTLAHQVLDAWHKSDARTAPSMAALFDREWHLFLRQHRIPSGYQAEAARSSLRRGLIRFAANPRFRDGWTTETELKIELNLSGVSLRGRVDRVDRSPGNHVALFDFKLTGESGLRDRIHKHESGALVQGGLYALALERQGASIDSVFFVPLRSMAEPRGWDEPDVLHELMDQSARQAVEAQSRILAGLISPAPLDEKLCTTCEFNVACRVNTITALVAEAAQ